MENLFTQLEAIHPVSQACKEYLIQSLKTKHYKKKEFVLRAGQVSNRVNYVLSGLLRVYEVKDGKEFTTDFFTEGDVSISLASFESKLPINDYVQAIEPTTILYLAREDLDYAYNNFPEANVIAKEIFARAQVEYANQRNDMKIFDAQERYNQLLKKRPDLILRIPGKYLASYLGVGQATLSRIRGKI